jgi:hypothetical protein
MSKANLPSSVVTSSSNASGDLSGTYSNPTVAKVNGISISGTPTTGQVLTATSNTAASWANTTTTSSSSASYGLAIGKGLNVVPVAPTTPIGNFVSNGTDTGNSYRGFIPLLDSSCVEILPVFTNQPNMSIGDHRAPNDINIAAAVELSDGTVIPFTFNGQHTVTIPRGGANIIPDNPINIGTQLTDAQWTLPGVYMRTYVTSSQVPRTDSVTTTSGSATVSDTSITSADQGRIITGTGIPANSYVGTVTSGVSFLLSSLTDTQANVNATASGTITATIKTIWPLNGDTLSYGNKVVAGSDLTVEGSAAGNAGFGGINSNFYGPAFLLATSSTRKPIIGSLTDSIFFGSSDNNIGPLSRAALSLHLPLVRLSKVSETVGALATPAGRKYRASLLSGCTHGIVELGTNDGLTSLAVATTIQNNLTTLLTYLNSLGSKWWVTTVPPKGSSSTDGYATTSSQTPYNIPTALSQFNTWIRGGCNGLSQGTIELGDVVSTSRDSGLWAPHPTRGRHLTDLSTTSGSNVVTSASANFTSADVGLCLFVTGVYTSYAQTITSVTDSQTVVMFSNAGSTVSSAIGGVGAWYATQDGTHPSGTMMRGGVLMNVQAVMSSFTLS